MFIFGIILQKFFFEFSFFFKKIVLYSLRKQIIFKYLFLSGESNETKKKGKKGNKKTNQFNPNMNLNQQQMNGNMNMGMNMGMDMMSYPMDYQNQMMLYKIYPFC